MEISKINSVIIKGSGTQHLLYMHKIATAVNDSEPLRYRLDNGRVVIHDVIGVGPTVGRDDHTFGYGNIDYHRNFARFVTLANKEIARVKAVKGLANPTSRQDIIHFSALPWIKFTSLSHARSFSYPDSVPKISVGKLTERDGKLSMPISVHVHHGLVDGYHLGQFIELIEKLFRGD
ncbi:MAG: chloramphenicol acetyltransferase [Chitinophagaceae bacterium]|nr:MAG: chloramphenicol acetyltransferase [Chitinophagaceae bacterium]